MRVEAGCVVDEVVAAVRNYCERAAREVDNRSGNLRHFTQDGRPPPSLEEQLEALEAWHAFIRSDLQAFKACHAKEPGSWGLVTESCRVCPHSIL